MRSRVLPLVLVFMPPVAISAAAQTVSYVVGQNATAYTDDCGEDEIAGFNFRGGDWMDGIMLLCRRPDGSVRQNNFRGGMGGTMSRIMLEPGERVHRVIVYFRAPYIHGIQIGTNRQNANMGQLVGTPHQLEAPSGAKISGFQFHAAQFLHGIAIITRPLYGAAPAPAPPPPPPPPPPAAQPGVSVIQWADGHSNLMGTWSYPPGQGISSTIGGGSGRWEGRPAQWYEYRCQTGRPIVVSATSADWDNVLYIVTTGGQQRAYNDDTNGTNAQISWTCPDGETYLIGVAAFNPASFGTYTLVIR